ncbi:MAG: hypothetical protein ACP5XB_29780 [Isosphaeraceae bacterium]
MMNLDDAWNWYDTTRKQLQLFGRLGRKHWDHLPWHSSLGRDDRLRDLQSDAIVTDSAFCLEHLDDFAVLILFSVFESIVRDQVLSDVEVEKARLSHALIARIVEEAVEQIEHGSFYQVLEDFKGRGKDGLVEEVNQVRRYRNWVAHGRRTAMPDAVDPDTAYRRLKRFLDVLGMTSDRVS